MKRLGRFPLMVFLIVVWNVGYVDVQAQLLVEDPAAVGNLALSVTEAIEQTATMADQLLNAEKQLEVMIAAGAAPAIYIWDRYDQALSHWKRTAEAYKDNHWGLDVDKFKNLGDLARSGPCYRPDVTCSSKEWRNFLQKLGVEASEANQSYFEQMKVAMERVVEINKSVATEAEQLQALRERAKTAEGQMEMLARCAELLDSIARQIADLRQQVSQQHALLLTRKKAEVERREAEGAYRKAVMRQSVPFGEARGEW